MNWIEETFFWIGFAVSAGLGILVAAFLISKGCNEVYRQLVSIADFNDLRRAWENVKTERAEK